VKGWLGRLLGRGPDEPEPERTDAEIEAAADAAFARLERLALPAIELELRAGEPVPEAATSSIGGRPSLPPRPLATPIP